MFTTHNDALCTGDWPPRPGVIRWAVGEVARLRQAGEHDEARALIRLMDEGYDGDNRTAAAELTARMEGKMARNTSKRRAGRCNDAAFAAEVRADRLAALNNAPALIAGAEADYHHRRMKRERGRYLHEQNKAAGDVYPEGCYADTDQMDAEDAVQTTGVISRITRWFLGA